MTLHVFLYSYALVGVGAATWYYLTDGPPSYESRIVKALDSWTWGMAWLPILASIATEKVIE